jgi:hypothetical protein
VLICLADAMNFKTGECYPSVDYIAHWCELSPASVRAATDELVRRQLIVKVRRQKSSEFQLLMCGSPESSGQLSDSQNLADSSPESSDQIARFQLSDSQNLAINLGTNQGKNQGIEPSTPPRKRVAAGDFVPPDWVPREQWAAYVEMRKKIRAPLTEYASRLTIQKLDDLRASGQSPGEVLDQSVQRGWKGVFEVKPEGNESNGIRSRTATEHNAPEERYRSGKHSLGEAALIFG